MTSTDQNLFTGFLYRVFFLGFTGSITYASCEWQSAAKRKVFERKEGKQNAKIRRANDGVGNEVRADTAIRANPIADNGGARRKWSLIGRKHTAAAAEEEEEEEDDKKNTKTKRKGNVTRLTRNETKRNETRRRWRRGRKLNISPTATIYPCGAPLFRRNNGPCGPFFLFVFFCAY